MNPNCTTFSIRHAATAGRLSVVGSTAAMSPVKPASETPRPAIAIKKNSPGTSRGYIEERVLGRQAGEKSLDADYVGAVSSQVAAFGGMVSSPDRPWRWLKVIVARMVGRPRLRRLREYLLSFGAYPGEADTQRGKRRIVVGAAWVATLLTILTFLSDFNAGQFWVAVLNAVAAGVALVGLVVIRLRPHRFGLIFNLMLMTIFSTQLVITALYGGLLASGLEVVFGLIMVLAALVTFGVRTAAWWFAAFVASVVYAAVIPNWVDPLYVVHDPVGDATFNLIAASAVTFAVVVYFVRQRDRFQKESDDLLHNILPDKIVSRLKVANTMIADSFESASVLFADVVGFTPMSVGMSPPELVGLLNDVFTTFDGIAEELGLEKIKTVGDEYMVASGVPRERPDHAEAIAEMALRMRDHAESHQFDGHEIRLRIGINSGPVVAGIIGTHKFAYDLWGDTVNTASRMESEGVPGSIQVSLATYQLIRDKFDCQPRGLVPVKGKGDMETYFLISRSAKAAAID
jgi:adenylate cyclase